ncbi:MAG: hypothetical protein AB7O47_05160 [Flavobacteriales bacterium]
MKRSDFLKTILLVGAPLIAFPNSVIAMVTETKSNFRRIYSNSKLRSEFYKFLQNVFNLYPENEFHKLIAKATADKVTDKDIYIEAQNKLDEITPTFSAISHQLPALFKQKEEMAKQAVTLLEKGTTYNGYLEIGSSGRYLDYLEEKVNITGERFYADFKTPGYSITEMIDRGQISIGANYIPMADYNTNFSALITNESLDLVTVYIGFHHCPLDLRIPFISSIRDTIRVGGKLILRDHDCIDDDQATLVALAHDVFNLGTKETWEYNISEIRNFYTLDFICDFVEKVGFKFDKRTLFQEGDPTKNALMMFTKI